MASVILPIVLSLFLGPGVGQLYNREFKKGWTLILVSLGLLIASMVWYFKAVQALIPTDLTTVDPQALQPLLTKAVDEFNAQHGTSLAFLKAIMTVLWIYGVVDAYNGAVKRARVDDSSEQ